MLRNLPVQQQDQEGRNDEAQEEQQESPAAENR